MNPTARKPIILLAIGLAIGVAVMLLLGLMATHLTFRQFQTLQRVLTFLISWSIILWAVLYAPLKMRARNNRIKRLEEIIGKTSLSSE